MYSKIVNPKTGRKVSVKSRLGKNILRKYLFILNGGAANERPLNEPPSVRATSFCCIHDGLLSIESADRCIFSRASVAIQ